MPFLISELMMGNVNTISIPTDAIFILFLLIVLALIGYFFHNILKNQTNQFVEKVVDNSALELVTEKLEDKLTLETAKLNQDKSEKPHIKKINFLSPSKFWKIGSLAVLAIGGSSLLRVQSIQNAHQGVNTSQIKINTENQSAKLLLSMTKLKSSNQSTTKIKKISYIDPLLSSNSSSKNNNLLRVKEIQTDDFFSF